MVGRGRSGTGSGDAAVRGGLVRPEAIRWFRLVRTVLSRDPTQRLGRPPFPPLVPLVVA